MPTKKKKTAHAKPVTHAGKGQTKTSFVLALSPKLSAKEVIAKAKSAGVSLSESLVYAIRSNAKRKARGGPRGARSVHSRTGHAVGRHSAEDLLKAAAAELGLSHAMSILQTEHDKVHRLLGG